LGLTPAASKSYCQRQFDDPCSSADEQYEGSRTIFIAATCAFDRSRQAPGIKEEHHARGAITITSKMVHSVPHAMEWVQLTDAYGTALAVRGESTKSRRFHSHL